MSSAWNVLAIVVLAATLGSCASDPRCPDLSEIPPGFHGGDGSTKELAIHPVGLEFTAYRWIAETYPNSKVTLQELIVDSKTRKHYDLMTFVTAEDEPKLNRLGF